MLFFCVILQSLQSQLKMPGPWCATILKSNVPRHLWFGLVPLKCGVLVVVVVVVVVVISFY